MPISRRQLLYAMLGALGLAAASGVLAIFIGNADAAWRVAGTALVAAFAAAIMMPMSSWADKPATRLAGLTGMSIAVLELLLAAVIIWGDFFPSTIRGFFGRTAVILGICGLTGVRFLKEIRTPDWGATVRAGAAGCAAAAGILLIGAYQQSFAVWTAGRAGEDFLATGVAFFFAAVLAAFCLLGLKRPDPVPWRWAGAAGAAAAFGITTWGIWWSTGGDAAWPTGAFALAVVVAHAVACLRTNLTSGQSWVRLVAILTMVCTGVLATVCAHEERDSSFYEFNAVWRTTLGMGLVAVSASLALFVFVRLNKKPALELRRTIFDRVTLVCPRCDRKLTIPTGGALCDGCKLHISVTILSTQCAACGYDLTDLRADRCPECGTVVPKEVSGMTET